MCRVPSVLLLRFGSVFVLDARASHLISSSRTMTVNGFSTTVFGHSAFHEGETDGTVNYGEPHV